MLRFQSKPDRVFLAILHAALECRGDEVRALLETPGFDLEEYRECFPTLARFFAPEAALEVIERLLVASRARTLYQLTDYHWLVIYDCLEDFCAIHNDYVSEGRRNMCRIGPYVLGRIDFDAIVDGFFWDTDFLTGPELLDLTPEQRREQLGFSEEAFGIAAGLAPHPDEVRIIPWGGESHWEREKDPFPGRGRIPRYPPDV